MSARFNILVIDDEEVMRDSCQQVLARRDYAVRAAATGEAGLALLEREVFDLILLDLRMPGMAGLDVLRAVKQSAPETLVVIITGHGTIASAVEAMKSGAYDFLTKPFTPDEMLAVVGRALDMRRLVTENTYLREELEDRRGGEIVIGPNKAIYRTYSMLWKVAPTDSTVLVTGESGTGKELIAKAIHRNSQRKDGPFIPVDCGSLVSTLFESEIFGHVKGAFTDAVANKRGKLESANGGTIFFDEIGNIGPDAQAKLLRAIQEREFAKVGDAKTIKFDARIVAATNKDLRKAIAAGEFREDLFYRINIVNIHLPPLRDRRDDIPNLVHYFITRYAKRMRKSVSSISPEAMAVLADYGWPGNIRELENVIERAVIVCETGMVQAWDLPLQDLSRHRGSHGTQGLVRPLDEVEREHIEKMLKWFNGHKTNVAKALGIDRKTLRSKIEKYGIAHSDDEES